MSGTTESNLTTDDEVEAIVAARDTAKAVTAKALYAVTVGGSREALPVLRDFVSKVTAVQELIDSASPAALAEFEDDGGGPKLRELLTKVEAQIAEIEGAPADVPTTPEEVAEQVDGLNELIATQRPVRFNYVSDEGVQSRREASPYEITDGLLLAYDHDREDIRTFRVAGIGGTINVGPEDRYRVRDSDRA